MTNYDGQAWSSLIFIPGSWWCVDYQDISISPCNISQELLDHGILFWTPPYYCIILTKEEHENNNKTQYHLDRRNAMLITPKLWLWSVYTGNQPYIIAVKKVKWDLNTWLDWWISLPFTPSILGTLGPHKSMSKIPTWPRCYIPRFCFQQLQMLRRILNLKTGLLMCKRQLHSYGWLPHPSLSWRRSIWKEGKSDFLQ